jgi:cytoskeleton protein RodZ
VAERKDKDPTFGRLDDLDEISSLPLGLRNGGPASPGHGDDSKARPSSRSKARARRDDVVEPGPAISVVSSLTNRTQPAPVQIDESSPGHPGAAMRFARERLGLDTVDLAARTRLSRRIIEDLESNRFDTMPPAYVRGYLRAVARELEGDADSWIRSYEGMGFSEPVLKATVQRNASARWGLSGGIWSLMVGAILASAIGLGVYAWTEGNGANPMASLQGWFSETRQRFTRVESEAPPDADAASLPALESAEELQWVEGMEPATPFGEPGGLDAGLVETEAASQEPELELPLPPARPTAPEADPDPAPRESVIAEAPQPAAATVAREPERTVPPAPQPEVIVEPGPEMPAAPEAAAGDAGPTPAPLLADAANAATGERSALGLSFEGTSWIEVRSASDRVALRGVFHAGDERRVVVEMPARVILGNAPAVRLSRDGRPVALEAHTREDRTARFSLGTD